MKRNRVSRAASIRMTVSGLDASGHRCSSAHAQSSPLLVSPTPLATTPAPADIACSGGRGAASSRHRATGRARRAAGRRVSTEGAGRYSARTPARRPEPSCLTPPAPAAPAPAEGSGPGRRRHRLRLRPWCRPSRRGSRRSGSAARNRALHRSRADPDGRDILRHRQGLGALCLDRGCGRLARDRRSRVGRLGSGKAISTLRLRLAIEGDLGKADGGDPADLTAGMFSQKWGVPTSPPR